MDNFDNYHCPTPKSPESQQQQHSHHDGHKAESTKSQLVSTLFRGEVYEFFMKDLSFPSRFAMDPSLLCLALTHTTPTQRVTLHDHA